VTNTLCVHLGLRLRAQSYLSMLDEAKTCRTNSSAAGPVPVLHGGVYNRLRVLGHNLFYLAPPVAGVAKTKGAGRTQRQKCPVRRRQSVVRG
jgi:hypothetical protein